MSKYIIDVEKVEGTNLWKAKGFNSLVFDQSGLDKLEKIEEKDPYGYKDDKIFLLSKEEYEHFRNKIPYLNYHWWLRSANEDTMYVDEMGFVYEAPNDVKTNIKAIRPALRHEEKYCSCLKPGDRAILHSFPWIYLGKGIFIAEVPIHFDKFDECLNDYKESDVRDFLLKWIKERSN